MAEPVTYEYDSERYVTRARTVGGRSIGITIPVGMRKEKGIRPGTKLLVKIRVIRDDQKETGEDGFRGPLPAHLRRGEEDQI